jgi:hypothetical protein
MRVFLRVLLVGTAVLFAWGVNGCFAGCLADDCGVMPPNICTPGTSQCGIQNTVLTCTSDGTAWKTTGCEANTTCVRSGDQAACLPTPDSGASDGGIVQP